jgi:transcriptional regulator with XRE-family HTH domain
MTDLSDRLKSRRLELGLSQNVLAERCGVSQPTIANWERGGHVPRRAALDGIAICLDVDPIWLLSGEQPAHLNPAHQHISRPIHNIPVYAWPTAIENLKTASATQYLTMSVEGGDLLAIEAKESAQFPKGTILIFDKAEVAQPGSYLLEADSGLELLDLDLAASDVADSIVTGQIIARLKLSIRPH